MTALNPLTGCAEPLAGGGGVDPLPPTGGVMTEPAPTVPLIGTTEVPALCAIFIDALRVVAAPAAGWKDTLIVQLPWLGCSVMPGQFDEVTRKSAASPPLAIVTALLVLKTRLAVPVLVIVTTAVDVAPTAVPENTAPPFGA